MLYMRLNLILDNFLTIGKFWCVDEHNFLSRFQSLDPDPISVFVLPLVPRKFEAKESEEGVKNAIKIGYKPFSTKWGKHKSINTATT